MKITVITPTGDRELAFYLCQKWIHSQTVKPDQWIVVDDGQNPMDQSRLNGFTSYVRRNPLTTDPKFTLVTNINAILHLITGDKILIMEDDEYYSPRYIEVMSNCLDSYEIAGIGCAKYYHLPAGLYEQHKNMEHASLAETAFRSSLLPVFAACVQKGMDIHWLDDQLWREVKRSKEGPRPIKSLLFVDKDESLYVGMKGLPGRTGIGIGHKVKSYKHSDTKDRAQLKNWIPLDYQTYMNLISEA